MNNRPYKIYRKKIIPRFIMRPYVPGEDMSNIQIFVLEEPKNGGMICASLNNIDNQWYISKANIELYEEV